MLGSKKEADFNKINSMLFPEYMVFGNFVSNSCLPNSPVFQGTNENCPTWFSLICNLVLFSQPCSNDIIQEIVRVLESFHFRLSESEDQSEIVYMSLIQVQQIFCYIKQVFLTCRTEWKKALTLMAEWVNTTTLSFIMLRLVKHCSHWTLTKCFSLGTWVCGRRRRIDQSTLGSCYSTCRWSTIYTVTHLTETTITQHNDLSFSKLNPILLWLWNF